MAQTTWDVSRQGGGTYEFDQDAQGNYQLKTVGFNKLNKLNLPELKKENVAETSTTDIAKAQTDAMKTQTSKAFGDVRPMYDLTGGSGNEGQQPPIITTKSQYKTGMERSPELAGQRPNMREVSGEVKKLTTEKDWRGNIADAALSGSQTFKVPYNTSTTAKPDQSYIDEDEKAKSYAVRPFVEKPSIKEKATTALKTVTTSLKGVKTALKPLANAVGIVLDPIVAGAKMVAGMVRESPTQTHAKQYFSSTRNGRIVTFDPVTGKEENASNSLYAGFNRTSAFGNLEKAGEKRIATREKTAAKNAGKWSQARMDRFNATTEKFKGQQKAYKNSLENVVEKGYTRTRAERKANPGRQDANTMTGGSDSAGGGRVICTELHRTHELSTKDWVRDVQFTFKKLTKNHIKGYLIWAMPTVKHIQKYPKYRKIWKHIAQHRANDIAWRLNEGNFDLLGRIYAGIGEPLCWLIGNFVNDTQYNELNIKNWRKA